MIYYWLKMTSGGGIFQTISLGAIKHYENTLLNKKLY